MRPVAGTKDFLYVLGVSHLEWTIFLLFSWRWNFYFLYVHNRFYEKKKKVSVLIGTWSQSFPKFHCLSKVI